MRRKEKQGTATEGGNYKEVFLSRPDFQISVLYVNTLRYGGVEEEGLVFIIILNGQKVEVSHGHNKRF